MRIIFYSLFISLIAFNNSNASADLGYTGSVGEIIKPEKSEVTNAGSIARFKITWTALKDCGKLIVESKFENKDGARTKSDGFIRDKVKEGSKYVDNITVMDYDDSGNLVLHKALCVPPNLTRD